VVNCNAHELKRFLLEGGEHDARNGNVTSVFRQARPLRQDQSRDGRAKLLAAVFSGYGGGIRELGCFDYASGQMLWLHPVAPQLSPIEVVDLDGDGVEDIVCGGIAVANGKTVADGSDDQHSYIFAFSDGGELLWRTELAGAYSSAWVLLSDLNADGRPEILVRVQANESLHPSGARSSGRILQVNYSGQIVESYEASTCLLSFLTVDVDGDGLPEVLCSDCEGSVHVLNRDLTLRRKIRVLETLECRPGTADRVDLRLIKAGRFAHAPQTNLLAQCVLARQDAFKNPGHLDKPMEVHYENLQILVLDPTLRTVARHHVADATERLSWVVRTADCDGDGIEEILSLTDRVEVFKFQPR
jgi:hypothetical protein